jgi:hypothetical protein
VPETVRILRVVEIPEGVGAEPQVARVAITYSTPQVPPRTIYVDKDRDSQEERQRVIKEDLEGFRAQRVELLEIP